MPETEVVADRSVRGSEPGLGVLVTVKVKMCAHRIVSG